MTTIGIDPGKNGGIAWIHNGQACVERMPHTLKDLWELVESIGNNLMCPYEKRSAHCIAYLEEVHSSPQMGVKSAFSFGNGFGHLEMALTAAGIPFRRVPPQVWQRSMKCLTGGNKNITKARAQELFPSIKVSHLTADALLIASYGVKDNARY